MRRLILLGASGNIGQQSLDVIGKDPTSFRLVGISIGERVNLLKKILSDFPSIEAVCLKHEKHAVSFQKEYPSIRFYHGDEGLLSLVEETEADMVENALVGFAGFLPSLKALEKNRILCLANKESLVVGGEIVNKLLKEGKGKLYPIDSEHVAIDKCLKHCKNPKRVYLTASGGPFRDLRHDQLDNVTPEQALAHPTWNMGAKISIDSATMMNKGFEWIEAYHLFHLPMEKVEIVIHLESEIHSAVEDEDGTIYADVGKPDMRGPISYALYEGKAYEDVKVGKSLNDFGPYHFREYDPERYPLTEAAKKALEAGGIMPAILNAANEVAVGRFLKGEIPFLGIERICLDALRAFRNIMSPNVDALLEADASAREFALREEF